MSQNEAINSHYHEIATHPLLKLTLSRFHADQNNEIGILEIDRQVAFSQGDGHLVSLDPTVMLDMK